MRCVVEAVDVTWGDQSGSGNITGSSAHLCERIENFFFQPASLAHAHTWYFRGMSLVRLEIASAHLCLWTNTHTYVHKRRSVKGFRSLTASPDQACLEWSLPVSHAFLMLGSANKTWREGGQGWATVTTESVLPQPRPVNRRSVLLPHNNRTHGNPSLLAVFWTQTASHCLLFPCSSICISSTNG